MKITITFILDKEDRLAIAEHRGFSGPASYTLCRHEIEEVTATHIGDLRYEWEIRQEEEEA